MAPLFFKAKIWKQLTQKTLPAGPIGHQFQKSPNQVGLRKLVI